MLNKRGDASDYIFILVILFFLAVGFLISAFVMDKMSEVVSDTDMNSTTAAPSIIDAMDNVSLVSLQRAFVAMFAILTIGLMVSAFLIRIHPAWIFIYIIFLAVTIFTSIFLANVYQDLTEVNALAYIAAEQTMTTYIMQHIVMIMLAVGALSMIITFSKIFTGGGYSVERL